MKDKVIYAALIGFGSGVLLHSFVSLSLAFILTFFLISFALLLYFLLLRKKSPAFLPVVAVFLATLAFGALRFHVHESALTNPILENGLSKKGIYEGVIVREPVSKDNGAELIVLLDTKGDDRLSVSALLLTERYPEHRYGERLRIEGVLDHPKNFETDGKSFDYVSYLKGQDIGYVMYRPKLTVLGEGGNVVVGFLYKIKNAFLSNITKSIAEPESALLGGILLGTRTLSSSMSRTFQAVGIVHIIALSGFNISLVGDFILRIFSFVSLRKRLALSSAFVILFTIMTGGSSTAVRALIMALLVILGKGFGRVYHAGRALLVAAFFMILASPTILAFDVSFQLSFLATFGLIYASPFIIEKMRFITMRWKLREIVGTTLATQVLVLPLLLYKTGILSFVSLPLNLLVLPVVPFLMVLGFALGFLGFGGLLLAAPLAYVSYALLWYVITLARLFEKIPFGVVRFVSFPEWLSLFLYALIAVELFRNYMKTKSGTYVPLPYKEKMKVTVPL